MQTIMRSVIAAFLLIAAMTTSSVAQDYPKASGYVNDFAHLLSQDQVQQLVDELKDFDTKTTIEIAVVTVPSLQGYPIEDYTLGLARAWGVGKKDKNNGVVLLVAPNERKVRIEVGRGLEGTLSNSVASEIVQNEILPQFRAGHMDSGIVAGIHSLVRRLSQPASVQPVAAPKSSDNQPVPDDSWMFVLVVVAIIAAAAIGVTVMILVGNARSRREAQEKSQSLLNSLPSKFAKTRQATGHADVTAKTKKRFEGLSERFEKIRAYEVSPSVDWIDLQSKLEGIETELSYVNGNIEADKKAADKARTEGPKLFKELPQVLKDAEAKVGDSEKRRAKLDQAWSQYNQAQAAHDNSGTNLINWLIIYELLTSANSSANAAVSTSHSSSSDSYSGSSGSYDSGSSSGGFSGGGSTGSW